MTQHVAEQAPAGVDGAAGLSPVPGLGPSAAPAVQNLDQLEVPTMTLIDLVLRRTFIDQRSSITEAGNQLGLSYPVVESLIAEMRQREWVEISGANGRDLSFSLTERGRGAAKVVNSRCSYAGVAPVGLSEYERVVRAQRPTATIHREQLTRAFGDLVVPDEMLTQLGPALVSDRAMFLYGPPGTGKSSIAERLIRAYQDHVFIPHAIAVDNQIVKVYDPVVHHARAEQPTGCDRRFVLCERPSILTGGELLMDMLELRYDQTTGIHVAPLQLTANNGLFIIDDFGRQIISPQELLNRWIVPLEREIDHLQLNTGVKFSVPFLTKVAFSTNLDPGELGDEAFFRRIPNKIRIGAMGSDEFTWVFRRVAGDMQLPMSEGAPDHLIGLCTARGTGELRAYLPRDFCRLIASICTFEQWAPQVTELTLDRAAAIYWPA